MSSIFSSRMFTWQCKNMEKLSPNRAQVFLRNEYTVFIMVGPVALRSVKNKKIRRATVLQLLKTKSLGHNFAYNSKWSSYAPDMQMYIKYIIIDFWWRI